MKALIYNGVENLAFQETAEPKVAADELLVQVRSVGICGSDLHAYLGHDSRRPAPLILGHEAAGLIVGGVRESQSVVINPLITCGICRACRSGRANLCTKREIISIAPRQGAFAQYIAIPEKNLVSVPAGMDMDKAALVEPIATGWHAVRIGAEHSQLPLAECRALVYGGGAVGMAAALSLHAGGCRDIHLAETNALRRTTVKKESVCEVFDPVFDNRIEKNSIDLVVDCVGGKATRIGACAAIRPGGVIVHVGLMDSDDGLDIRKLTLQEITFIGSYTYTMDDFQQTVAAMHSGKLGSLDWYTVRSLSEGAAAFSDLLKGRTGAAKIILKPHG